MAADPLQPTATATTVRNQGGKPLVLDGPFAETKEQLAGYYIIDCKNLDEAIEWANKIPTSCRGSEGCIEIRPIAGYSPREVLMSPAPLRRWLSDRSAEALFAGSMGRIIASLIRVCGSFDRAEEAMQEAFASALRYWGEDGIPENPAAWITAVAPKADRRDAPRTDPARKTRALGARSSQSRRRRSDRAGPDAL